MVMRLKKEYLVLIVIILAAVAYLYFHKQDRELYTLPVLPKVSADDITRLDITREGKTVSLTKNGGQWLITPGDYLADGAVVKGMLFSIADLSVTALVSESKAYKRYDLGEDKRIQVTAYGSGNALRSVDIGKAASTFQHTFIKLPDDDRVYHGAGDFRRKFDRDIDGLRDKVVLAFQPEKISAITVTTPTRTVQLSRSAEAENASAETTDEKEEKPTAMWTTADGKTIAGEQVDPFLNRLNRLTCSRFIDDAADPELGAPVMTVALEGEKSYRLDIFPESEKTAEGRPAGSSETAQPFLLASWIFDSLEENVGKWVDAEETSEDQTEENVEKK
jgi:hypothetical protein